MKHEYSYFTRNNRDVTLKRFGRKIVAMDSPYETREILIDVSIDNSTLYAMGKSLETFFNHFRQCKIVTEKSMSFFFHQEIDILIDNLDYLIIINWNLILCRT